MSRYVKNKIKNIVSTGFEPIDSWFTAWNLNYWTNFPHITSVNKTFNTLSCMTAVYVPFNRQRTLPNRNMKRSVQGQINQILWMCVLWVCCIISIKFMVKSSFVINFLFHFPLKVTGNKRYRATLYNLHTYL